MCDVNAHNLFAGYLAVSNILLHTHSPVFPSVRHKIDSAKKTFVPGYPGKNQNNTGTYTVVTPSASGLRRGDTGSFLPDIDRTRVNFIC
jgi:hypothetical protein